MFMTRALRDIEKNTTRRQSKLKEATKEAKGAMLQIYVAFLLQQLPQHNTLPRVNSQDRVYKRERRGAVVWCFDAIQRSNQAQVRYIVPRRVRSTRTSSPSTELFVSATIANKYCSSKENNFKGLSNQDRWTKVSNTLISPLQIACESRSAKLIVVALDTVQVSTIAFWRHLHNYFAL
jgi:hypothetical protein